MTLKLLLMRHAKSDWPSDFSRDHDRPLASRGIKAAQQMGRLVAQADQLPELIVTSTARRAQETTQLFIAGAGVDRPVQTSDQFYESLPDRVLAVIRKTQGVSSLMVVGHEPTWSELARQLMGGGMLAFPTAAIARIDFEGDRWSALTKGTGTLKWLLQPKFFG